MKLSSAVLFLSGVFGSLGATMADPFRIPDAISLKVKILDGTVCDADTLFLGGVGLSDPYVIVSVELADSSRKYCGLTTPRMDTLTPVWNEEIDCGEISKADWGDGVRIFFKMVDADPLLHDNLGEGFIQQSFKYGQRSSSAAEFESSENSKCGTSKINFDVITPVVTSDFCLQLKPNGPYYHEIITDTYYQISRILGRYEDQGYEVGYEGETKTIDQEPVTLDAQCNQPDATEVTFCTRDKTSNGECGTYRADSRIQENQQDFYEAMGFDIYSPGTTIEFHEGTAVINSQCATTTEDASSYGDPHFKTWSGKQFDFHGGCDLVLVQNPKFNHGLGMNIHVRTRIHSWWSSIESAALQLGDNTLQIRGGFESIKYWIDGTEAELETGHGSLGDFAVNFRRVSKHQSVTRVDLGNRADAIGIETYKHFVRVNIHDKKHTNFQGSTGLLGAYPIGQLIGRDGKTLFKDPVKFGQEWMVRPTDRILFNDVDATHLPLFCAMPEETVAEGRRRLGESAITQEEAAEACSRVNELDRPACIFDVLATNDKDMAGSY